MSRSTNIKLTDPAQKILQWKSEEGYFQIIDLSNPEIKIKINPPLSFIVLDELQTIKGWSTKYDTGIYSNMWKGSEPGFFKVKINKSGGNDFPIVGHWKQIKEKVKAAGGYWVKIIYALIKVKDNNSKTNLELVKIELKGLAVKAYMDYVKNPYVGAIEVKEVITEKKLGKTFVFPKFQSVVFKDEIKDKMEETAMKWDEKLQEYLTDYFKLISQQNIVETIVEEDPDPVTEAKIFADKAIKSKQTEFNPELEIDENDLTDDDPGDLPF